MYQTLIPSDLPPVADPSSDRAPIAISADSQLFIDDHLIARKRSVHRRLNRPAKERTPFLTAEKAWEGNSILYSCVIEVEGEYRLYYKAKNWSPETASPYPATTINLARSIDGITFEKRDFDEAAIPGTNIVLSDTIDDFTVVRDRYEADTARRFKLLASRANWREGLTPAVSSDGLRWTWGRDHAVRHFGDRCAYWYDPVRRKHIAWSRNLPIHPKRVIFHAESDDFETWSSPRLVVSPDRLDHPEAQIYGGYGFWYRSIYLAYIEVYDIAHQRLHTELASSRDGLTWSRLCDHDVFLPNGEHGAFDAYWIVPTFNPPIPKDGQLLIHYGGRPDPHKAAGFAHIPPGMGGALSLSTLREDGFVSLDATGAEGIVETHPLQVAGGGTTLAINVCPFTTESSRDPMHVVIEVMDERTTPLAAYRLEPDAPDRAWFVIPIEIHLPDVVRLRFRLRNARLYSFRIQ